ncbi:hypothetical protein DPMN_004053 [Dreissena polymorpha]|uniref:Uncharacterized protein n=1 Tax=Dreissena polymorpha TaxID=45954 RepID=A0A9D4RVA5_DREPO|nr:hypothetical protein DPMN_004053 [Dreissena polymorpha]
MLHMKFNVYKLFTDRRTAGRRTLSDHNSSPRAIAQVVSTNKKQSNDASHWSFGGNVTSRVFTKKNVLTKFLEYRDVNLLKKNSRPPGGHVFQPIGTIFELAQGNIWTKPLIKFHDDLQ